MSLGLESTHSHLVLYTETAIPYLSFDSKTAQLQAGRVSGLCLPAYLNFKYHQPLDSLLCAY